MRRRRMGRRGGLRFMRIRGRRYVFFPTTARPLPSICELNVDVDLDMDFGCCVECCADGWQQGTGSNGAADYWGTKDMNTCCGRVNMVIPADITAGDYLLRAEVVALHVAGSLGGAQLYMSCCMSPSPFPISPSPSPLLPHFPPRHLQDPQLTSPPLRPTNHNRHRHRLPRPRRTPRRLRSHGPRDQGRYLPIPRHVHRARPNSVWRVHQVRWRHLRWC